MSRATVIRVPPANCSEQIVITKGGKRNAGGNSTRVRVTQRDDSASQSAGGLPPISESDEGELYGIEEWENEEPVHPLKRGRDKKERSSRHRSSRVDRADKYEEEEGGADETIDEGDLESLKQIMNNEKVDASSGDIVTAEGKQEAKPHREKHSKRGERRELSGRDIPVPGGRDNKPDRNRDDRSQFSDEDASDYASGDDGDFSGSEDSFEERSDSSSWSGSSGGSLGRSRPRLGLKNKDSRMFENQQQSFGSENIAQKARLLARLERLRRNNGKTIEFTSEMTVQELQILDAKVTYEVNSESTVRIMRRVLLFAAYVAETLTKKFPWIELDLEGYSELLYLTLDSYDEVLYNVYDEHVSALQCNSLLQLLLQFGSHMTMFSVANKFRPKAPSLPNPLSQASSSSGSHPRQPPVVPASVGVGMQAFGIGGGIGGFNDRIPTAPPIAPSGMFGQMALRGADVKETSSLGTLESTQNDQMMIALRRQHEIEKAGAAGQGNGSASASFIGGASASAVDPGLSRGFSSSSSSSSSSSNNSGNNVRTVAFPASVQRKGTVVITNSN